MCFDEADRFVERTLTGFVISDEHPLSHVGIPFQDSIH